MLINIGQLARFARNEANTIGRLVLFYAGIFEVFDNHEFHPLSRFCEFALVKLFCELEVKLDAVLSQLLELFIGLTGVGLWVWLYPGSVQDVFNRLACVHLALFALLGMYN